MGWLITIAGHVTITRIHKTSAILNRVAAVAFLAVPSEVQYLKNMIRGSCDHLLRASIVETLSGAITNAQSICHRSVLIDVKIQCTLGHIIGIASCIRPIGVGRVGNKETLTFLYIVGSD